MYKCYFSTRAHYLIFFFQNKVFFYQLIQQIQFFTEKYLLLFQILRANPSNPANATTDIIDPFHVDNPFNKILNSAGGRGGLC